MPAKRKAAAKAKAKAALKESSRPSRSATGPAATGPAATGPAAKAGSKRKGSASPAPPAKKGVGAKKAASENEATGQSRQSARGRSASKQKEEETPRGRNTPGHATRAAVEEVETKRAASRGRSKTPSTPKQTKAAPKATTPRTTTPTPSPRQTKGTPQQKAATPRQRSATPKSKPSPATPKQKAATPKSQKGTPKQKATPKQATPKQTPKAKQKVTPKKPSPKKEEPPKRAVSRSRRENAEDETTETIVSQKKSSPRKIAEKKESSPAKQRSRTPRRSRGMNADETDNKEEEEQIEPKTNAVVEGANVATDDSEQATDGESKNDNVDESEEKDDAVEDDKAEAMETDEAAKEDENVEQDQVEESKPKEAEADEIEEMEATEEQCVAAESTAPSTDQKAEAAVEEESKQSEEKEPEEDVTESQAESEQVESEDKECESAESEQVEADTPVEVPTKAVAEPIVINEESGDSVEAEVISDASEKGADEIIELNEDSGDAVIVLDSKEEDSGDQSQEMGKPSEADPSEEIQNQAEAPAVIPIDNGAAIEIAKEAMENDASSTSTVGNGLDRRDENESAAKKRKLDDVEDVEDSGEFSKKSKITVDGNNIENGTVSQEVGNDDDDDFVVIEMSDVPPTNSNEVKDSIPKEVVTQSIATGLNPIFNREFVPNPAFTSPGDMLKQFSLVSYNILADCHLFRNDYSFTENKFLVPEYRLEKIIEELKYLDGDIICMQEVDPAFFSAKLLPSLQSIGYAGFHKKRTEDYFNEGEATFYKTSRFTVVEAQLHRQADLIEKVLAEGSVDMGVQAAVRKYVDLPDVVVITKLRCNNTGAEVTVGNVHINWGEMKTPDVQCVQIASAVREAIAKAGNDNVPHIICGDFNSPPLSPGYLVARDGYPSGDETITKLQQVIGLQLPEGKTDSLVNCLWPAFQHTSSSLKSAYNEVQGQEPSISSYNKVMCDCVDYIFYSSSSIDNVGVYRVPSKEKIMETGGTPNLHFPSDHMSIKAVLSFK